MRVSRRGGREVAARRQDSDSESGAAHKRVGDACVPGRNTRRGMREVFRQARPEVVGPVRPALRSGARGLAFEAGGREGTLQGAW